MEWLVVWFEQHPGTASWAQAAGTLVALAVAVAVPLHQNYYMRRQAALRSHEEALQLFDSLGAMANFAGEIFGTLKHDLREDNVFLEAFNAYEPRILAGVAAELDRYPIYRLPDHDSVATALEIKTFFARASAHLEQAIQALQSGEIGTFAEESEMFCVQFRGYSESVKDFSEQAAKYRTRIAS